MQHVDARQHEIFYEMENVPPEQHGRVLVLEKFREFFANNLCIAGESLGRSNGREYARFPRLSCWLKKSGAIALILSDGTFQINFNVSRFRRPTATSDKTRALFRITLKSSYARNSKASRTSIPSAKRTHTKFGA